MRSTCSSPVLTSAFSLWFSEGGRFKHCDGLVYIVNVKFISQMKMVKAFLILLLVTAGCVTHVETVQLPPPGASPPAPASPAPQRQTATDKRVVIIPPLDRAIHIVRIKSATGPEGYLKIQLNVQNLTDSPKRFTYHIDWLDHDGLELPMAASVSLPWMLLGRETSFLAATAPTPAARDFRVTFLAN
jgi:uncharacterized protein YcfL